MCWFRFQNLVNSMNQFTITNKRSRKTLTQQYSIWLFLFCTLHINPVIKLVSSVFFISMITKKKCASSYTMCQIGCFVSLFPSLFLSKFRFGILIFFYFDTSKFTITLYFNKALIDQNTYFFLNVTISNVCILNLNIFPECHRSKRVHCKCAI